MRCKRCGSVLSYEDVMCKGCGKSLIDLKAKNEIEFDDNATISVEPIKHEDIPKVQTEEKKSADIFGDAIYNKQNSDKVESIPIDTPIDNITPKENNEKINAEPVEEKINFGSTEEKINAVPIEEKINFEPIEEKINAEPIEEKINFEPIETAQQDVTEPVTDSVNNDNSNIESITTEPVQSKDLNKQMSDEFVFKKKTHKGIIFVIITLIILVLGGIVAFIFVKTNPKSIFETGISKLFSSGNLEIANSPVSKNEVYFKLNIEDAKQNTIYNLLNNLSINLVSHIDKTNKNLMVSFDSKYDNSSLLKATVYGSKNKLYSLLEDVYEKYIGISLNEEIYNKLFEENNYLEEIKTLLDQSQKELIASLDKNYFTRSIKGTDTISTFSLNKTQYVQFVKALATNVKNNDKLINSLSSLTTKQANDIKQSLENIISTYSDEKELKIEITSSIIGGNIKNINVTVNKENEKSLLTIEALDSNNYNFVIKANDSNVNGSINIENKDGFKQYSFTIKDDKIGKVTYTVGYKSNTDEALTMPDLTNTVDYDKMTSDDKDTLLTNLFQKEGIMKMYEAYSKINTTESTATETDSN